MIFNGSRKIKNDGGDYLVLTDYGCDGLAVTHQAATHEEALQWMTVCSYGSPHTLVKLVRVAIDEQEREVQYKKDFESQVTMIRNFPSHVGDYDSNLPEKQCGEYDYSGQCRFRDGWSCAVDAINERLSEMQNPQADRPDGSR